MKSSARLRAIHPLHYLVLLVSLVQTGLYWTNGALGFDAGRHAAKAALLAPELFQYRNWIFQWTQGTPADRFYPPIFIYFTSAMARLTGRPEIGLALAGALFFLLMPWLFQRAVRGLFGVGVAAAALGALLLQASGVFICEMIIHGILPNLLALLPLCVAMEKMGPWRRGARWRAAIAAGFWLGVCGLIHSAAFVEGGALVCLLAFCGWRTARRDLAAAILIGLLGTAISAVVWAPLLTSVFLHEGRFIQPLLATYQSRLRDTIFLAPDPAGYFRYLGPVWLGLYGLGAARAIFRRNKTALAAHGVVALALAFYVFKPLAHWGISIPVDRYYLMTILFAAGAFAASLAGVEIGGAWRRRPWILWTGAALLAGQAVGFSALMWHRSLPLTQSRSEAQAIARTLRQMPWDAVADCRPIMIEPPIVAHWFNRFSTRWQISDDAFPQDVVNIWAVGKIMQPNWRNDEDFLQTTRLKFIATPANQPLAAALKNDRRFALIRSGDIDLFALIAEPPALFVIQKCTTRGDRAWVDILNNQHRARLTLPLNVMRGLTITSDHRPVAFAKSKEGWIELAVNPAQSRFSLVIAYRRTWDQWLGLIITVGVLLGLATLKCRPVK